MRSNAMFYALFAFLLIINAKHIAIKWRQALHLHLLPWHPVYLVRYHDIVAYLVGLEPCTNKRPAEHRVVLILQIVVQFLLGCLRHYPSVELTLCSGSRRVATPIPIRLSKLVFPHPRCRFGSLRFCIFSRHNSNCLLSLLFSRPYPTI